jgi:hypothetical protein
MIAQCLSESTKRFESSTDGFVDPVVKELAYPARRPVAPEVMGLFLEQIAGKRVGIGFLRFFEPSKMLFRQVLLAFEQDSPGVLERHLTARCSKFFRLVAAHVFNGFIEQSHDVKPIQNFQLTQNLATVSFQLRTFAQLAKKQTRDVVIRCLP